MKFRLPFASIALSIVASLALLSATGVLAQGGGPSDTGASHRADPCKLTPDNAQGVQRNCQFGASSGVVKGDFNGDGIADLAIGVPNETRTNLTFSGDLNTGFIATDEAGAGAVNILFGSATGVLGSNGSEVLDQVLSRVSQDAHFGTALAAGKFHSMASPVSDLAVGVPGVTKSGGAGKFGTVWVFNNTGIGLSVTAPPTELFAADITHLPPVLSFGVAFPKDMSMTWGDFNGDGFGDLAVEVRSGGACDTCISGVVIYFGSANGLSSANHQAYDLDDGFSPNNYPIATGCPTSTSVTSGNHFCAKSRGHISLSSSDLNGDGKDELLVGSPGCHMINDSGSILEFDQGCVAIIPGRFPMPDVFFNWSVLTGDRAKGFGSAIAIGDFDGDGMKDIAVGQMGTAQQLTTTVAGSVRVFHDVQLSNVPFAIQTDTLINQDTPGIGGTQSNARFGASLTANDFNGDGVSDLAIGAPNETVNGVGSSGQVNVIYGLSGTGLATAASSGHPAAQTIAGDPGSKAGTSLTAWNFGKSSQPDLVIGEPFADVTLFFHKFNSVFSVTIDGAGVARALYGSPSGLDLTFDHHLNQSLVSGESATAGNHFGAAVY